MLCDFPEPFQYQFRGSVMARRLLALFGWKVRFAGLPALQGVLVVYPHTSNWDFIVMILAKWAVGVQVMFWGKDTLFRIPLFGAWLRWVGGVPVDRSASRGVVGQAADLMRQSKEQSRYFWLGLSPEGTRHHSAGWRSGFYRSALAAGVPLGLIRLDYARREVVVRDFIQLSGDETHDMARIHACYAGVAARYPEKAAPVTLLGGHSKHPQP
jgi:1-acyl-sn-glycerol-3-phosphate acyltransferase